MSDACGQARALTVLTPVKDEPALRAALAELPTGNRSPLDGLPATHFGRWVVLPDRGGGAQLLFTATHDRGDEDYVRQVAEHLKNRAGDIWGHCEGYPPAADTEALTDYLKAHRVTTNLFVSAYPKAPLAHVEEGLDLRERLGRFAPCAQWMDDPEKLRTEFRKAGLG